VDEALAHLSPITSQVQGLIDFVGSHPHFALVAVFLLALSEAVPVVGTVVPGSTAILGISALATTAQLDPWLLLMAATLGRSPVTAFRSGSGCATTRGFCAAGRSIAIRS